MPFSVTQYETAVNAVAKGAGELRDLIPRIGTTASIALSHQWYLPAFVKNAIRWCADQLTMLLKEIGDTITDLLKGAIAPLRFITYAGVWQREIRGPASAVAGTLKSTPLSIEDAWSGRAYDAYMKVVPRHSDAADRIAKIAARTAQSLNTCAAAGFAFYVGLGFVLYRVISAAITAVAAFSTAVFSWAGAVLIYEEAAINLGLIILFTTTLAALLGAQANEMMALRGEAVDMTMFPRRSWPTPATGKYSDATVKDGDADWSVRQA